MTPSLRHDSAYCTHQPSTHVKHALQHPSQPQSSGQAWNSWEETVPTATGGGDIAPTPSHASESCSRSNQTQLYSEKEDTTQAHRVQQQCPQHNTQEIRPTSLTSSKRLRRSTHTSRAERKKLLHQQAAHGEPRPREASTGDSTTIQESPRKGLGWMGRPACYIPIHFRGRQTPTLHTQLTAAITTRAAEDATVFREGGHSTSTQSAAAVSSTHQHNNSSDTRPLSSTQRGARDVHVPTQRRHSTDVTTSGSIQGRALHNLKLTQPTKASTRPSETTTAARSISHIAATLKTVELYNRPWGTHRAPSVTRSIATIRRWWAEAATEVRKHHTMSIAVLVWRRAQPRLK